ncbi:Abi family protein [Thomasclavelia sp.]|uniref:Abi family protein n=1 Tax=Thomasclavelia sp. TaxID=3025757 RepID=UPI0025CF63A5|nr:Abi family protein [Thomasclavelia sp.]
MYDKPFKTYRQQMKHLRDNKKINCTGSKDKQILLRNGYFNLINGYKSPFIFKTDKNGVHTYIGGTSIKHFKAVKHFDDELRYIFLKNITKIEEEIRTLVGHKFDYTNNHGKTEWFEVESYNPNVRTQDKIKIIAKCYYQINKSKQLYVAHYLNNHNSLPTWVFIKVINFSTFIDFISISKSNVINSICRLYSIYDSDGKININLLISMLHWMRIIRNSCAHNERIYGISKDNNRLNQPFNQFLKNPKAYTKHRSQHLIDLIVYLRYFMQDVEYQNFIHQIKNQFSILQLSLNKNAFEKVRAETGIKNISVLDELARTSKFIDYNKFEEFD